MNNVVKKINFIHTEMGYTNGVHIHILKTYAEKYKQIGLKDNGVTSRPNIGRYFGSIMKQDLFITDFY